MMINKERYSFEDLKEIIRILRAPDGCPWDREQTHESLKPCVTEEAAEVVAAIRIFDETGNDENLCEELGDLLLQVLMHSEIALEDGRFNLEDVIDGISKKMIRRHPHIFGTETAEDSAAVLMKWDDIKRQEKQGQTWLKSELRDIPQEFPTLIRAQKVQKKLEKVYHQSLTKEQSICDMESLLGKLKKQNLTETEEKAAIQEMLWETANLARTSGIHAEQLLTDKIEDVIETYE